MCIYARLLALSLVPVLAVSAHADVDAVTLLRLGLGAKALTAAGVTAQEVSAVVDGVAASDQDLAAADAGAATAKQAADGLAKLVRAGDATDEQKNDYQAAKAALAQAEAARQTVLDAMFADGVAALSSAEQATLSQIRANMDRRGFATELLTASRTDAQWIELKRALQHEKVCTEDEEEVHPDVVSLLASVRAASAAASARANLDAHLTAVTAAWIAAAGG